MKKIISFTTLTITAVAAALLLAAGCASGPVVKKGTDFSRYKTFAIAPITAKGTYQDPALVTRFSKPVQESVTGALKGKGYQEARPESADLLVNLKFDHWAEEGRMETRLFNLQIVDRASQDVVWSDYHHRTTDTALPEDAIRKAIADMLKPFPAAK
jgi:hypothetical protein